MSAKKTFAIPAGVTSISDLQSLIREVQLFEQWVIQQSVRSGVRTKRHTKLTEPEISDITKQALRSWQEAHELSARSLQQMSRELEAQKLQAKTITIILAAPVTPPIKERIVTWCRASIGDHVFVNFEFSRSLLGGMIVRTGSKIHDWSYRSQILAGRNAFPEVLRNVQ